METPNFLFGSDGKLRSGWRFAAFTAVFVVTYIFFVSIAFTLFQSIGLNVAGPNWFLVHSVLALAIALVLGWLAGRFFERLPFDALGASFKNGWLRNSLIGLVAGVATFALAAGVAMLFGGMRFSFNADAGGGSIVSTLLISFVVFATAAAFEEALFRGYILQTFIRSDLTAFGIVLTSLLFASIHNSNPSANLISWANTFIAGIWFGIAYLKTRDLWLPTALHLAWNWAQGSIFGIEVSGLTDISKNPLLREMDLGPAWLTGGSYGMEGGIVTTIALLASTAVIWVIPFGNVDRGSEFKL
jgi:membrane protease YdiL (CAAX protease family)